MVSEYFTDNPSSLTIALGSAQPLIETSIRNISRGERQPLHRADNLTTFMCHLSWNLWASASWNPQSLFRPVMGFIIKSFQFFWSIGHPWRASRHYNLLLSPWPCSIISLCFLIHPLLSFTMFSSASLFFYIPEDSNLMLFSLLTSDEWFSIVLHL